MINKAIIQIFVSCPGDVKAEKEIVWKACKDTSELLEKYFNIGLEPKDWTSIVAKWDGRPQKTINNEIKTYDIYLGILWMRFGSPTGAKNPQTGEDFESGTEEEFVIACQNKEQFNVPEIALFFREPKATNITSEIEQLCKVTKFRDTQEPKGWINRYKDELDFQRQIQKFLIKEALERWNKIKAESISELHIPPTDTQTVENQIKRSISGYNRVKGFNISSDFGENKGETLIELINQHKRIILLGDAGSGKSTELRTLNHDIITGNKAYIPIYQSLNLYTTVNPIELFLPEYWKNIPKDMLVIIWDGLDEIQPQHFNTTIREITRFSEKFPELRIIISCRTNFYELPANNVPGTLAGFEPYFIRDIVVNEAKEYYSQKFQKEKSESFIEKVFELHLDDLIKKPFFLMVLANIYAQNESLMLNRTKLFEEFITLRFKHDIEHYKTTVDNRPSLNTIQKLLERIALGMEILCKNVIEESDLLEFNSRDDVGMLEYSATFKKKIEVNNVWQFEHNNIQEYFAAKALAKLPFGKIRKFIAFAPDYKKINPSWVNTLSFLISILNGDSTLLSKIINWIIKNDKEVIVKFEREKIPENIRVSIVKKIFHYYKKHDVWINTNKFNYRELSRFGQSEETIRFLIKELNSKNKSKIVKTNAIHLLGYFDYTNNEQKNIVRQLLVKQVYDNLDDLNFIYNVIYAFRDSELYTDEIIEKLISTLWDKANKYSRAALYSLILKSKLYNEYIDYLIDGLALLEKGHSLQSGEVRLADESWNLEWCLKSVDSSSAIKRILKYLSENNSYGLSFEIDRIKKEFVENAIKAYIDDNEILDYMVEWFFNEVKKFNRENEDLIVSFFDKTKTREIVFNRFWEERDDANQQIRFHAIGKLITQKLIVFVIDQYNSQHITNEDLQKIYYSMQFAGSPNIDIYRTMVNEKTVYKITPPPVIDHNKTWETKRQQDFDILFSPDNLKNEILRIFADIDKTELWAEDLSYKRNGTNEVRQLIDDEYSGSALRLLREFTHGNRSIKKNDMVKWFANTEYVEFYCINSIYQFLTNNKDVQTSDIQRIYIEKWCEKNVNTIDYKSAITVEGKTFHFNTKALFIWFFMRKFGLEFSKKVMLDMLSFYSYDGGDKISGIEYIINKVPEKDIKQRIIENLKQGTLLDTVFKNHVKYVFSKQITELYPLILKEFVNINREEYIRGELLDNYFDETHNIKGITKILGIADYLIRWSIIDKLIEANESTFVSTYLLDFYEKTDSPEEKIKIAEYLISLQNVKGLEFYLELIKQNIFPSENVSHKRSIYSLKIVEAIPCLMQLLDISYRKDIKIGSFENLTYMVLGALQNIALVDDSNFKEVKKNIEAFRRAHLKEHDNIKYLMLEMERIESQFYMNKAKSYTIRDVKEKLRLIEEK